MHTFDESYFDAGLDRRGTRCEKWTGTEKESVLPLWVADMDFPSPPEVAEAIAVRALHPTYGYTLVLPDDTRALTGFWQRRHNLTIQDEWVMMIPCVVTGIRLALLALTKPGDGVMIQSPVYGPFRFSVEATERRLMDAPLKRDDTGRYSMDLDAVEKQLQAGAKALVLCNPHNPVSRAWKREELQALIDLLARYGAYLIADEIHADFVYAPEQFVPVLSLAQKNVLSLCAASKTFNLAGLEQAAMLVPDEAVRAKINTEMERAGVRSGNLFALEGTRAAYEYGDAWLDGLMRYLDGNRKHLTALVKQELPQAVLTPMEATYLGWLDLRAYGMNCEELMARTLKHGVQFTEGTFFGEGGEGFLRVNIGCPRRNITEGIHRLKEALDEAVEEKAHGVD